MRTVQPTWSLQAWLVLLLLGGCAGSRLHSDGMQLAARGDHDAALPQLQEASRLEPSNSEYRIDLLKELSTYTSSLIKRADAARLSGDLGAAGDLYRKALTVDPANDRARRGLGAIDADTRVAALLDESDRFLRDNQLEGARAKANAALAESPRSQSAQKQLALVDREIEKQREAKAARAAAQSVMARPVTLQFRDANLRMVFEALSRTTGLNVILDRDVRADLKTTIFVKDAAVEDTVDLILLQNQLEKRSLNANTLFVYPATAAKQKEYQDLQVRTFQVANADVKYLQTVLKTVLKIKDLSFDERSNTLVIRDTPAAIAVAAKVIAAHDLPEPEVMLEVEVLEVSYARLSNIGIQLPNSFSLTTPAASDGTLTLGSLKALTANQLLATPLSATLNLKLEDTDANILASPRIRARNKEKARILIGDRIPTITNSVTPLGTGSGVVTGQVQYQDVGLKLDVEPQVYPDQDIGIKINLEVSTIVKEIPGPNGSLAYQIGTRNAQTVVRLRDGETQVLGGLISAEDRNAAAKVPGLGHLPVVGRLFGNNNGSTNKSEIVLSITPHILRPPTVVDASLRDVFSGTDSSIRQRPLQLDATGPISIQTTGSGAAGAQGTPANGRPGAAPASTPSPASTTSPTTPRPAPISAPVGGGTAAPSTPQVTTPMRNMLPLLNGYRPGGGSAPAQPSAPVTAPTTIAPDATTPSPAPSPAPAASEPGAAQ